MDPQPVKDRRLILVGGAALALVAGLAVAVGLSHRGGPTPKAMDAVQKSGLQVEMSAGQTGAVGDKQLRCFVGGRFVAITGLADCARRNGVATAALDVGLDPSGAVAATGGTGVALQPLPQPAAAAPPQPTPVVAAAPDATAAANAAACWRYNGQDWRTVADSMTLNDCVQTLFAGRCERPGAASYGRWGEQTLRLVPGRVERSYDNRTFTVLTQQPADCRLSRIQE